MLVTLCNTQRDWISCFRAPARCWRGQEQMLFCSSLYSGRPSRGPSETSHRFKADMRWSDPLFKNCNRHPPLRYLTGMWTSSHAQGITSHQTIQIRKEFPCVRWARAFGLFPYCPVRYRTQAFPRGAGIYFIQPGQYRRLRYLPTHLSLLLTAYGTQSPKE